MSVNIGRGIRFLSRGWRFFSPVALFRLFFKKFCCAIFRFLAILNKDIREKIVKNEDLLYVACVGGDTKAVKRLLLEENVDVNLCKREGVTFLHIACSGGHAEIVSELLKRKDLDVNIRDESGATPLFIACTRGHTEVAQELLKRKDLDGNICDKRGCSPMCIASLYMHGKVIRELRKRKDINLSVAIGDNFSGMAKLFPKEATYIAEKFKSSDSFKLSQEDTGILLDVIEKMTIND